MWRAGYQIIFCMHSKETDVNQVKKELNKKYSYKEIFRMLSKYKKVRINKDAPWEDVTKLKYIEELTKTLDVYGLNYGIL